MEKMYKVKVKDKDSSWIEELSLQADDPMWSARRMVKSFNKYLRPGEKEREIVEIIGLVNEDQT